LPKPDVYRSTSYQSCELFTGLTINMGGLFKEDFLGP